MKVLIGMECSGRVREEFRRLGHDAWSCDYLPAEDGSPYHIQGNVFDHALMKRGWDLGIFHPECTWATSAGARWMSIGWRRHLLDATVATCKAIMALPIEGIAIENPPGRLSTLFRPPDQIIHPWQHGQRKLKPTCLWLKNLPLIVPTEIIKPPRVKDMTKAERAEWCEVHLQRPGPNRSADRARTYEGIVRAYGQWGAGEFTKEAPIAGVFPKTQANFRGIEAIA